MRYALARGSRVVIEAAQAKRFHEYICPKCRVRVNLRRGNEREYFAHWPGEGSPECEDYFWGSGSQPGGWTEGEVEDAPQEAGLGLDLRERSWRLFLRVPEVPNSELGATSLASLGRARLAVEANGQRLVELSAVELRPGVGHARVHVPPIAVPYALRPYGSWPEGVNLERWALQSKGLNAKGTPFRLKNGEWTRLRERTTSEWGENLVVVGDPRSLPPALCRPRQVAEVRWAGRNWCAWHVTLPLSDAPDVSAWLLGIGSDLVEPPWRIRALSGPRAFVGPSLVPQFHVGDRIMMSVAAPNASQRADVELEAPSTRKIMTLKLPRNITASYLEVVPQEPGSHTLTIDGHVNSKFTFDVTAPQTELAIQGAIAQLPRLRLRIANHNALPWSESITVPSASSRDAGAVVLLDATGDWDVRVALLDLTDGHAKELEDDASLRLAAKRIEAFWRSGRGGSLLVDAGAFGSIAFVIQPAAVKEKVASQGKERLLGYLGALLDQPNGDPPAHSGSQLRHLATRSPRLLTLARITDCDTAAALLLAVQRKRR